MMMDRGSLMSRLVSSYIQVIIGYIVGVIFAVPAWIVGAIGFTVLFLGALAKPANLAFVIIGLILVAIFYLLYIVAYFGGFIFAATRGHGDKNPIGFMDAYVASFKLILELSVVIVFAFILFIIGFSLFFADQTRGIGFFFFIIGGIVAGMFPAAALYYVLDFLKDRETEMHMKPTMS